MENDYLEFQLTSMAKAVGNIDRFLGELKNSICIILGCIQADGTAIPRSLGNGFGDHQIEEIKNMIVELHIQGSIRKRSNGLIELRTQALGSIYGRTREEIELKLNSKLREAKDKKEKPQEDTKKISAPLLSEFFENSYLPYKRTEIKETSIDSIILDIRFVLSSLPDKRLNLYTTREFESFILSIPSTRKRQKIRGSLNNIFAYAKRIGVIKNNPCENVIKMKHVQKKGRALSFAAQNELFDLISRAENLTLAQKLYLTFVFLTGTRRAEACNLCKEDFDVASNSLHIPGTKTDGSDRTIPLSPLVKKLYYIAADLPKEDNDSFFGISNDVASRLLGKLKMEYHLHELRHTFGTIKICVDKLDPKTVSLYMGHSTVTMTLERYTHPEQLDKEVFYNGELTEEEKHAALKRKHEEVLAKISAFLNAHTQNIPNKN